MSHISDYITPPAKYCIRETESDRYLACVSPHCWVSDKVMIQAEDPWLQSPLSLHTTTCCLLVNYVCPWLYLASRKQIINKRLHTGWKNTTEIAATFSVCLIIRDRRSKVKNHKADGRKNIRQDWDTRIALVWHIFPDSVKYTEIVVVTSVPYLDTN